MQAFRGHDFLSTLDFSPAELRELVGFGLELKRGKARAELGGRSATLLFCNPSLRTRLSCSAAMTRYGGSASSLHAGRDSWQLEWREGVTMDGDGQEHLRELAPVLSRYSDLIGLRRATRMAGGGDDQGAGGRDADGTGDEFLERFRELAEVPVVNLESNRFHPLQGLADRATLVERLGEPRAKKFVLSWAWHPKSLPVATPHSQLIAACDLGMHVTLLHPAGQDLEPQIVEAARQRAESQGGSLSESDDIESAYRGARVVCAKAWGALGGTSSPESLAPLRAEWMVDEAKLALSDDAFFMHCLPVRRNVVVADAVLDSNRSAVVDQAENRLWTAAAVFHALLQE